MEEVRLKKITDSIGLMQKNLECSICLDLLQDPVSTKCDHQFCNFCVLALLQSSSKPSARCPLCKIVITKRSLTKNEQLDQIVKAVRSVITAVEEDSGLRCSPPRGPVLFSQPDPKPRQPTPQKKVKGQTSAKVKGQRRAGNVRKTKRKAAETVSVYRDDSESNDSDAFELPLVGHTNISSSFPRLKTSGKKGYHDNDQENEELEREAEDLLAALNAAPLTSHGNTISGYSHDIVQRNNDINLHPINSENPDENGSHTLNSQTRTHQDSTPCGDSEIFEVPAPKVPWKVNLPKEGEQDPYEFVPSQRTPRKVKKKAGRRKNQNAKKEFPIRKERFTKPSVSKRDHKSASSCSESDHDGAMHQSKTGNKCVNSVALAAPSGQRNAYADSKTRNTTPTSGHLRDGGNKSHSRLAQETGATTVVNEEDPLLDSAEVVIDDTGDCLYNNGKAPPVEGKLMKYPLPITPVVIVKRTKGAICNVQGSQRSSEGGMMTDSQPVVINRNHGTRVFATTYGKAKNGVDKSPPLDPQKRILDWLVSKNAGSDESGDEVEDEKEKEVAGNSEELPDILNVQENDVETPVSLPKESCKDAQNAVPNITAMEDQSEPAKESKSKADLGNKKLPTPKKREGNEALEKRDGKRRSGRHSKETGQEKRILDAIEVEEDTSDIKECSMSSSKEQEGKKHPPKPKTAKKRMEENYNEQTAAARKESAAAAIKSDWELALELARQFGTEPEHLKTEPNDDGGRSSRRRKGKLTIEPVPESKPVRKSRRHVQEHQRKEKEESNETIDIDSFETQNLNTAPAKRTVKESNSSGTDKRKFPTSDKGKPPGNQANIQAKDQNCDVQRPDTPEATILKIPETPFISNQPAGKTSLEGGFSPKTGFVEVESQKQDLESSKQRMIVHDIEGSSIQSAEYCTPESNSSQPLTLSLRRSKRGSQPGPPSSNSKVSAQVMSGSMEKKKKKAKITDEVQEHGTDSRRARGSTRELSGADDLENQVDFILPVMKGTVKEAEEKVGNEETALASLPLYTEDIPTNDKDKKCRGSDTTESIDLEVDSDEYEEEDDAMEKEPELPSGASSAMQNIHVRTCSSSEKQLKPSLDEEMSIMDCILPSTSSQECPALGISPAPSGNSDGVASDQMERDDRVYSMSQKPDEVLKILSGSSDTGQQSSQASVTIVSQVKTSGSFPVSLDLNTQPSESLLQLPKKSKRKTSQDGQQASTLHTQDAHSVKKVAMHTSPGAKQQVQSTTGTCNDNDMQEAQTSSGSGNSRLTRRISRRKRKTFTIDACAPVSASPVPDSVEHPTTSLDSQMESKVTKKANLSRQSPSVPSHRETHEADILVNINGDSKAPVDIDLVEHVEAPSCFTRDRNSPEVLDEKLKSPQTASPGKRKKIRSLLTSDSKRSRKRGAKNIDNSEYASPTSANTSQESFVSDMSASSLKLKRKSRNSGRHNTRSPVLHRDIKESVVQPSASDQNSDRLPDAELNGECSDFSRVADVRLSPGRRSKIPTKPAVTASGCSAIPTTPGASELNEQSSNGIIPARLFQLHSKINLIEGAEVPDKSPLTPKSSPRVLRRSSRQSREMAQHKNETVSSNVADWEKDLEQRIKTPPQKCITVVDESIGMSLAEKEESQESYKSSHSVEDIFNIHEESRDMFDEQEEEEDKDGKQDSMGIEESQSLNADIMLLSEDGLLAKDSCSPSGVDDTESRAGYASQAKQEVQRKSPGSAKKSQHLDVPEEIDGTKDAAISQGSCQYDDTEALIPPTPPVHEPFKSRASSFLHTSGLSKAIAKRKKAHVEMAPDMSSLLCPNEEIVTGEQDSIQMKSLVMETPTVGSRRRNKASHSQTKDKSIADTPVKPKHGPVGRKGKVRASDQNAVTNQTKCQEGAFERSEKLSGGNWRQEDPPSKTRNRVTSQIIGDTPLEVEVPIKSSNESDEVVRTNIRQRKQVITDDVSDVSDDDGNDDEEFIGRQKRKKAQRMVQVARDEEDESDDELIPCSFLQTSVQKPIEIEEEEHEDIPIVTFGEQATLHLGHEVEGGSVSSEDSCASHHMNLTSASSILSSQSEIMNTQQQEKTREHMQALEEQMAELQAALASERGSRSHDDTNDEEEEENPRDLLVEETEEAHTPASKQNGSTSSRHQSPERTKRRSKAVETSDEEDDEMDEEVVVEPRSPSPPPPLSPRTMRKASSSFSMTDSIRSATSMVEHFRKSSSKKVTAKKRRIEEHQKDASDDDDGSDDDDAVAMVSLKSPRNSKSPRAGSSSRRSPKKRRIERQSMDSDEDEIQDRSKSPPKSRSDSIGRKVERRETALHGQTPSSWTTPTPRTSGSRKSPSNKPHKDGHHTPQIRTPQDHTPGIRTPRDHLTPRRTPGASSSASSPADVSMKTQRTSSEVNSPGQSKRRSGDRPLRTPEGGPGPSLRPMSRPMSIIATGLNRLELRQVEQLTSRLANCRFASAFNANTTHVIVKTDSSLVCERTLKYFQGIAARAWIVSFQWIHDSLKARKLLGEEVYEVKGDVVNGLNHHGPKRSRKCEGPGFMAKFDLCCIGPFTGLNKDQLVGLCEMCGASTVQHPSLFPYNPGRTAFIVVEPNLDTDRDYQGLQRKFRVPVISREWILDSIAHYKSQPITEYVLSDHTNLTIDQPIIDLDSDEDDQ